MAKQQATEDAMWLFDFVFEVLHSPTWEVPIASFIDENCLVFDNEEENKLVHTDLHEEFKEIVERLLNQHLAEIGVCQEDFFNACDAVYGNESCQYANEVIEQIIACDDFLTFKTIMFKRNKELELEAISSYLAQEAELEGKSSEPDQEDLLAQDEEEDLELALQISAISAGDLEQQQRLAELEKEQADVETAIALSLAIEEERQRIYDAESKTPDADASPIQSKLTPSKIDISNSGMDRAESKTCDTSDNAQSKDVRPSRGQLPSLGTSSTSSLMARQGSIASQRQAVEDFLQHDKSIGTTKHQTNIDRSGIDEVELARRAKHLKAQREKILKRKREEREAKLREYEKEKKQYGKKAGSGLEIPKSTKAGISDGQYLTYALARKMKHDMATDQSVYKGNASGVSSSLDAKLRAVEDIRKEKAELVRGN